MKISKVLTIAGSDSSGGAGIQADIKTITALNCYAASAISCITAQNTQGVQAIEVLTPNILKQQIESVLSDIQIDSIKIGLLSDTASIYTVRDILKNNSIWTVLDPVLIATSGDSLTDETTKDVLTHELMPLCDLVTPNISEAESILDIRIENIDDMKKACKKLKDKTKTNILLKGGHLNEPICCDILLTTKNEWNYFENEKIQTNNTHGTGCTLSSAIACYKAKGNSLVQSAEQSIQYVQSSLMSAKNLAIGKGNGPIYHMSQLFKHNL